MRRGITNQMHDPEETRIEELFFRPSCMAKLTPVDGKCPVCGSELNIENAPHHREVVS